MALLNLHGSLWSFTFLFFLVHIPGLSDQDLWATFRPANKESELIVWLKMSHDDSDVPLFSFSYPVCPGVGNSNVHLSCQREQQDTLERKCFMVLWGFCFKYLERLFILSVTDCG